MANGNFEDFEKRLKERYVLIAKTGFLAGVGIVLASFVACFYTYRAAVDLSSDATKEIKQIREELVQVKTEAEVVATKAAREVAEGTAAKAALERIDSYEKSARKSSTSLDDSAKASARLLAELNERNELQLNSVPAARAEQISDQDVPVANIRFNRKKAAVGTMIDFLQTIYDTDGAVAPKQPWRFKVRKPGIYHVTASVACEQDGGLLVVGLCANQPPDATRPNVFLAQATDYKSGTIIGGSTDIDLGKDTMIDIRVYVEGVAKSKIMAVGTTHVSVHYVRPPLEKKK